ncbi:MAG: FtsW/RodA/SpoVE family cell cycle protein, partial [Firmicutes bacterium]|nr:FtsW/RodA/SpoVE family cell cycle protein [Bacillota bacterium]
MKQIGEKRTRLRPDWWLLVAVIILTAIGIIMVFSASQYFAAYEPYNDAYKFLKDQLFNAFIGLIVLIVAFQVKIKFYKKLTYPVFIGLLGVLVFMVVSTNIATIG